MYWAKVSVMVFNATYFSVISWLSVLLVEETIDLPQATDTHITFCCIDCCMRNNVYTFVYNFTGVCVVSWYPPGQADNEGKESDSLIPKLLDTAALYKIKVNYLPFKYRLQYILKSLDRHNLATDS